MEMELSKSLTIVKSLIYLEIKAKAKKYWINKISLVAIILMFPGGTKALNKINFHPKLSLFK